MVAQIALIALVALTVLMALVVLVALIALTVLVALKALMALKVAVSTCSVQLAHLPAFGTSFLLILSSCDFVKAKNLKASIPECLPRCWESASLCCEEEDYGNDGHDDANGQSPLACNTTKINNSCNSVI